MFNQKPFDKNPSFFQDHFYIRVCGNYFSLRHEYEKRLWLYWKVRLPCSLLLRNTRLKHSNKMLQQSRKIHSFSSASFNLAPC